MTHLLLASRSSRRAELLTAAGYRFDVAAADIDEAVRRGEGPADYVARVAAAKAAAVAAVHPDALVLGADTAVVIDGDILGKPADESDATAMLERLSGRTHEVLTGVTIRVGERTVADVDVTQVRFTALTAAQIAWYVASGEPRDKAGAYAIQGLASRFIDRIDGSYSNVVGLPMVTVERLLGALGRP